MASIFRIGIPKLVSGGISPRLCKASKAHNVVQVAFLTRVSHQVHDRQYPKPFPYWRKQYTVFQQLVDPMMYRFQENSKILVVEGPPSVGKEKVCEKLAEEFGMLYMPAPSHDEYYINHYGFDLRKLDSKLPLNCQSFDLPKFLANPNDPRTAFFQFQYFQMRYEQYVNGLLHLLSTGQGIVLNRWFFSEVAFAKAMCNAGYIRPQVLEFYMHMRDIGVHQVFRPHTVIYLDVPVDTVKEKIKKGGTPEEVNSKIFTSQYLADIEKIYKENYLKDIASHSHVVIYDWSKEGDPMHIVDQLEDLEFEKHFDSARASVPYTGLHSDWFFTTVSEIRNKRAECSNLMGMFIDLIEPKHYDIPDELLYSAEDMEKMEQALKNEPTEKYEPHFNPELGDQVLWKTNTPNPLFNLRRTPRDFVNRDKYMT